ncbi:AsmA family protein [Flavobacterium agricola]|uniref:AsmA family protein n=1 Tax=Flavobacterium agricola TaxID=2870839 RepID=A0ABY6M0M6_9FLAO|nr:AsmA family protein [Flavobacterium agricola]UYW00428.1 AsmA family protein [Flavobacterium agricola]
MIKRIVKIFAIFFLILIILIGAVIFVIPRVYKTEITQKVEQIANQHVDGTVKFDEFSISIIKYFPAIIIYVKDLKIENEKFIDAKTVAEIKTTAVGVNFHELLKGKIVLDAIFIDEANLNLEVDSLGVANFNILKPSTDTTATSSDAEFKIRQIVINNSNIKYNDKSAPLTFKMDDLNYKGLGDLSAKAFDLNSTLTVSSFDFSADNVPYVQDKPIMAEIVTEIDAEELKFKFERNNIKIKNFPFSFNGYFSFIKDGYDLDLTMKSQNSTLEDMLSLVPPDYEEWKNSLNITGGIEFEIITR